MNKKFVILLKILGIALLLLIILLVVSYFLIQDPKVQTKLVHYYTTKLSKDWNTKVEIGDVEVDFFNALTINDIYVEDHKGDTLMYASKLETKASLFQPFKKNFLLNNSKFHDLKLRLKRSEDDSLFNFNHLLANASSDKKSKDDSEKQLPNFKLKDVSFINLDLYVEDSLKRKSLVFKVDEFRTDFRKFDLPGKKITARYLEAYNPTIVDTNMDHFDYDFRDDPTFSLPDGWEINLDYITLEDGEVIKRGKPKKPGKGDVFAFNYYYMDPIDLRAENIVAKDGQLDMDIKDLSFIDKTGFEVNRFKAHGFINADDVNLKDLVVEMQDSHLEGDLVMNYRKFSNFKDFEKEIGLNLDVKIIDLKPREFELLFGSDILKETIHISGGLSGTLADFTTKDFYMSYDNGTVIKGNIDARGLPDLGDTFFDAQDVELSLTQYGLQEIMGKKVVPEQVKRFGDINYQGDFVGYITDLIVYGDLNTEIGDFLVDLKYSDSAEKEPEYSGYVATSNFQLGQWLDNKDLDQIDFSGTVSGRNFDLNRMQTSVDATINTIDYKGKQIEDVELIANLNQQVLEYDADINDNDFVGRVIGSLDYSKAVAINKIEADVVDGDLFALGITDSPLDVSGQFNADLVGNAVEELQGTIDAQNANVVSNGKSYDLGNLGLEIVNTDGKQNVGLVSENASVKFIGDYNYTQLFPTVLKTINEYYDFNQGWEGLENTVQSNEEIGFEVEIDPKDELIKLILPDIQINSGVNASGNLNPISNEISILALADSLAYESYSVNNWVLDAYGDGETLYINSFQDNISNNGKRWLTDSEVNVELSRDDILADVRTYNENFLSAKLTSRIKRLDDNVFEVSILSSDLVINEEAWEIEEGNSVTLGGGTWEAENFSLRNGEQRIQIYNPVNQENTKLIATIEKLSISDINSLVGMTQKEFEGQINGGINLIDRDGDLNFDVNLTVEDLLFNGDQIDVTTIDGIFNIDKRRGSFDGLANDDDFQFVFESNIDLNKQQDMVDVNIDVVKSSLSPLANIWEKSVEDMEGFVDGNLQIIGGPNLFRLAGDVNVVEDIAFTLKFTKSRYTLPVGQDIDVVENGFVLNDLTIRDPFGSEATLNGQITHRDLKDYTLNISGEYENFLFLNTTNRDNEVFYGDAFATGDISFTGPVNDAFMQVNATSEPSTNIFIDNGSAKNTSEYSFIRFKEPEIDSTGIEIEPENQSKLSMKFDLDILPNAQVNLNFDSEGYNTLKGNGYGDMVIEMDTEGLLQINGIYEVNQGAYLVNFRDIFERPFKIEPGSFVQWAEDPYDARLRIGAQYQLKADVSALSSNANNIRNLNNATTNLNVDITGSLSEPEFTYNIELEDAQVGSEINNQINIINGDQTKLDNQIGSLLLWSQFSNINSNPFSDVNSETIAIRSVTNILTSRLTGFLNEAGILQNTTFGVEYENYRDLAQQDLDGLTRDQQVQLQLSSRFLNNRVEVEYGGDFNFGDGLDDNVNAFEVGDFVLTYKLNESGTYKFKVFSTRDFSIIQQQEDRRNGFGFVIEREFNTFKEAFEKEKKPEEENQEDIAPEFRPALEPDEEISILDDESIDAIPQDSDQPSSETPPTSDIKKEEE